MHSIEHIVDVVCTYFGLHSRSIYRKDRSKSLVMVRHLAWWFVRDIRGASLSEVAHAFGVDHTSVLHAVTKIDTALSGSEFCAICRHWLALRERLCMTSVAGPT